jgi:hypothetical protein
MKVLIFSTAMAVLAAYVAFHVASEKISAASKVSATATQDSGFSCDRLALTPDQRKRHFDELGPELRSMKKGYRELPDGYEFEFPADPTTIQTVAEWAAAERTCCPFLDIDLHLDRERGPFWLQLSGRKGVKQFIRADFTAWFK